MASKKRLHGLRAIAAAYGVSPSTAHRWLEVGALPSRKLADGTLSAARIPKRDITRALAAATTKRADQRGAETAARNRMFRPSATKRARELGIEPEVIEGADIAAFVVNVFSPEGDISWGPDKARRAVSNVLDRLLRVLGGDRVIPLRSDGTPDPWRGQVTFPRNVTEAEIADALERADFSGGARLILGGRVHFGLYTDERVFVPITHAHARPRVAVTECLATLARGGSMIDSEKNRRAQGDRKLDRDRWKTKKQRQRSNERFRARENERTKTRRAKKKGSK